MQVVIAIFGHHFISFSRYALTVFEKNRDKDGYTQSRRYYSNGDLG